MVMDLFRCDEPSVKRPSPRGRASAAQPSRLPPGRPELDRSCRGRRRCGGMQRAGHAVGRGRCLTAVGWACGGARLRMRLPHANPISSGAARLQQAVHDGARSHRGTYRPVQRGRVGCVVAGATQHASPERVRSAGCWGLPERLNTHACVRGHAVVCIRTGSGLSGCKALVLPQTLGG